MFCEDSLGKIKFRAFPKRAGPRIKSLGSVDLTIGTYTTGARAEMTLQLRSCTVKKRLLAPVV